MAPCVYYSGVGDIECSQKLTSSHQLSLQDKNAPSIFITRPWIPGRTLCPPPWPKLLPYTDWSCVRNCCCVIIHNVCSRFGVGDISRRPRLVPLRVCLTFVAPRGIPVKERQQLGWPLWVLSHPPHPSTPPFLSLIQLSVSWIQHTGLPTADTLNLLLSSAPQRATGATANCL